MAFTPGFRGWFMLDGANGTGTIISPYTDNVTFPQDTEMLETTTLGSASKRFIAGLAAGGQIGISGPLDSALGAQITGMLAAQAAGTAGFTAIYAPAGSAAGSMRQTVEVLLASVEYSTGVGGRAEYSASLQMDGAIANATW